jgi:hypothetical protein
MLRACGASALSMQGDCQPQILAGTQCPAMRRLVHGNYEFMDKLMQNPTDGWLQARLMT